MGNDYDTPSKKTTIPTEQENSIMPQLPPFPSSRKSINLKSSLFINQIVAFILVAIIFFIAGYITKSSTTIIVQKNSSPYLQKNKYGSGQFRVKEINLVSSVQGYAPITDNFLTDAWGLEFGDPGRVWINSGGSGNSVVYNGQGQYIKVPLKIGGIADLAVQVPSATEAGSLSDDGDDGEGGSGAPLTGMVFSKERAFLGDAFTFITEQGTIAGWSPNADGTSSLEAQIRVDNYNSGAVYKGVTSAKTNQGWLLYVANFGQGRIDVFNSKYESVPMKGFIDPTLPSDYAPFNVKSINNQIYVTYAKQSLDKANDVAGPGNGYVSIFTNNGKFVKRLISKGVLNSPWGLALTPTNFGSLSNYFLVGNFGDGYVNIFNPRSGEYIGTVDDSNGNPLQIDGLWSLTFGTNNGAGKNNELFFSAGPSKESQGLFGKLQPIPEQK